LENHIRKHRIVYQCAACQQKFLSTIRLNDHISEKHLGDVAPQPTEKDWGDLFEASINCSLYLPEPDGTIDHLGQAYVTPGEKKEEGDDNEGNKEDSQAIFELKGAIEEIKEHTAEAVEVSQIIQELSAPLQADPEVLQTTDDNSAQVEVVQDAFQSEGSNLPQDSDAQPPQSEAQLESNPGTFIESNGVAPLESNSQAPLESNPEVPLELHPEVPLESNPDAPLESNPDIPLDSNPDAPLESNIDVPLESNADVPLESNTDAPLESNTEVPLESDAEVPLESDAEVPLESDAEVPLESNPEAPLEVKEERMETDEAEAGNDDQNAEEVECIEGPVPKEILGTTVTETQSEEEKPADIFQKLEYQSMNMDILTKLRETFGNQECEFCGRLFYSQLDYEPHVKTHTGMYHYLGLGE
jgi:hypothetical protein